MVNNEVRKLRWRAVASVSRLYEGFVQSGAVKGEARSARRSRPHDCDFQLSRRGGAQEIALRYRKEPGFSLVEALVVIAIALTIAALS
ncbi:MAG: prepilin-type N-terminal cleavage/methylation domain-containing protein, partial [Acidobacteriota bacterium]|nr:prepilin-type N-terminal cleavage/methylation domain-containing protein [Acidobacteriota bacterium]